LVYCSNCGEKIGDDANFCPKCGAKTPKGRAANAVYPADQILREGFYGVGAELEKAFTIADKEIHAAFQKARENLQQKTANQRTVACPKCGSKNTYGSIFCNNCGSRIAPVEGSHGGDA
jgi:uncharacterized membrane protein YvbJ